MSIALDDQQTQQIFLTLAESLDGGEPLADETFSYLFAASGSRDPPACHRGDSTRERSRSRPSIAASDS